MSHESSDPRTGDGLRAPRRLSGRRDGAPVVAELDHSVKFYESETLLCDAAADFICEGLKADEPVLLVITPKHVAPLDERIKAHGIDPQRARHEGQLMLLDAEETLARFLVRDMPDGRL